MTPLSKPVTRLTRATVFDGGQARPLVVTLDIDGITLKQHGTRHRLTLPFQAAWRAAAQLAANREQRDKQLRRRSAAA